MTTLRVVVGGGLRHVLKNLKTIEELLGSYLNENTTFRQFFSHASSADIPHIYKFFEILNILLLKKKSISFFPINFHDFKPWQMI